MADDLQRNDEITAQAIDNFVSQFKDKTKLAAFAKPFLDQIQDLEISAFELKDDRTIDASVGVQLDGLGRILVKARGGLADDRYRDRLRAQALINRSNGRSEEIIAILRLLETSFFTKETPPAAFEVSVEEIVTEPSDLAGVIALSRGGAVRAVLIYTNVPDGDTFTYGDAASPTTSTEQGYGDAASPGTGGQYAGAVSA